MISSRTLSTYLIAALAVAISAAPAQAQVETSTGYSTVDVPFGDDSSKWANDGECDDPRFQGPGAAEVLVDEDIYRDASDCMFLLTLGRISLNLDYTPPVALTDGSLARGTLQPGDTTLESGEYMDSFTFEGGVGQQVVIDLRSKQFDPYLIVRTPSGEQFDSDDYEGDARRSLLTLTLDELGTHYVRVTSYQPGEVGEYTVRMQLRSAGVAGRLRLERGRLEAGDNTLRSGEFVDEYQFTGRPGQRVSVGLRSDDFDTYIILTDPAGDQQENDDGDGTGHSLIEADLTEAGTYHVLVTSYEPGEVGAYELTIVLHDDPLRDDEPHGLFDEIRAATTPSAAPDRRDDSGRRKL